MATSHNMREIALRNLANFTILLQDDSECALTVIIGDFAKTGHFSDSLKFSGPASDLEGNGRFTRRSLTFPPPGMVR